MKHLAIQTTPQVGKVLTKEQKRFNSLLDRIKTQKERLQNFDELDVWFRQEFTTRIQPVRLDILAARRNMVLGLWHSMYKPNLKKKFRGKLNAIIYENVVELLGSGSYDEDQEINAIFYEHRGDNKSFKEVQQEEAQEEAMGMLFMANAMFGFDFKEEDIEDPEKLMEKMSEFQAKIDAEEAEREEKKQARAANRKKSAKQLEAAEKKEAAQKAIKKSIKQLYNELVIHFHPDKEQDEVRRLEKTEIMKEITAAYQNEDYLSLLDLQMRLLAREEHALQGLDDAQLRHMNQILEDQCRELEVEFYQKIESLDELEVGGLFDMNKTKMDKNFNIYAKRLKDVTANLLHVTKEIQHEKYFKLFIETYDLQDELDGY